MKFLFSILLITLGLLACDKDSKNNLSDAIKGDKVVAIGMTEALNGSDITYQYDNGMKFHVQFTKEGLSYQNLAGSMPDKWWGPFPYQARYTENGEYFVSWYEEGYGDHVTLLLNFENNILHGSAIIPKGDEVQKVFSKANIIEVNGLN